MKIEVGNRYKVNGQGDSSCPLANSIIEIIDVNGYNNYFKIIEGSLGRDGNTKFSSGCSFEQRLEFIGNNKEIYFNIFN